MGLFYALTAGLFAYLGIVNGLNIFYGLTWTIAVVMWSGQYIQLRLPQIKQGNVNFAKIFSQNVWIGFILLLGIIVGVR